MLLVQKYLVNKTFGDLERDHAVEISVDRRFGHKFSLNYNQIAATDSDILAQQCRGLILTTGSSLFERAERVNGRYDFSKICPGSTRILAYPMNRFFNYGQEAAHVDWNDSELKTFEKLDGTLCIVYFDSIIHEWHVATRSVPEADIPFVGSSETFRTLFEKGLQNVGSISFKDFCKELDPEKTYCYELTSPYNRVVVNYPRTSVTLIAVRHNLTHKEILPEKELGSYSYVPVVRAYELNTIDKIVDFVNTQNPMDHEGIVLRDSKFNRIKIKNAMYVAYNKARDSLANSPRACLEIVLSEKADDVVPFMPEEIANDIKSMQSLLAIFLNKYQQDYRYVLNTVADRRANDSSVAEWNDQKLFAKCVQQNGVWEGPSYAIYAGKCTDVFDYIRRAKKMGTWSNSFLDNMLRLIQFSKTSKMGDIS